jgi:phospholipid/cholesterol/gamma-HCH transport system substrate-binding protein
VSAPEAGEERGASTPARIAAAGGLIAAFLLVGLLLFGGSSGNKYKFLFETGGQLVSGNEVLIAGQPVGTIDSIELTDDSQAEVEVTTDRTLTEGTTAVIRSTSLSGVANRYISLTLGPDNAPEIGADEPISGTDTTSPVDLDQLFNVFRPKERRALQKFIQGNATVYAGKGRQANRAYKFLNPALSTSQRLLTELSRDSVALERFLVEGADTFGAIADRRDDLASLVVDANTALGAVANQNEALDRSLVALPGTLRQANTTFVNLRTTLDDLDPLVAASYPGTENLAPFLRRVQSVAHDSRPVFKDLGKVVKLKGKANDLRDALGDLPTVRREGNTAWPAAIAAMDSSQDNLAFFRPYGPDVFGFLTKLGESSAYYDANGHYARISPTAQNIWEYNAGSNQLDPIYNDRAAQYDAIDFGIYRRCPGGGTQQAADLSNPFLDDGNLGIAECDPSDLPPGP